MENEICIPTRVKDFKYYIRLRRCGHEPHIYDYNNDEVAWEPTPCALTISATTSKSTSTTQLD